MSIVAADETDVKTGNEPLFSAEDEALGVRLQESRRIIS
jgi:hypothetical protein